MKNLILIACIFLLSLPLQAYNVGDTAPDFSLTSLSGSTVKLSSLKGKVVMVFFFGYNCPSCIGAGPAIQSNIVDQFKTNTNFVALGIDMWDGSKAGVQNFKDASRMNIPLLLKGSSIASSWNTVRDRLLVVDAEGKFSFIGTKIANSDAQAAKESISTALENMATDLQNISGDTDPLVQITPNPIKNKASLTFKLDKSGNVKVSIYNLSGTLVSQLYNATASAGKLQVDFNRENLPNGVYFYRVNNGNTTISGKILLK